MRVICERHLDAFAWCGGGPHEGLCVQCIAELLQADSQEVLRCKKCSAVRCGVQRPLSELAPNFELFKSSACNERIIILDTISR
jgi:hypothetical protein